MNKSNLTFVSAFIKIYETPFENKDIEWRIGKFRIIAETGIQLCIYISPEYETIITEFVKEFPNVKIMKIVSIQDTFVFKVYQEANKSNLITLPNHRNEPKDTVNYMLAINSKVEFINDAIQQNPWSSTHFAWIDFSIAYVLKDIERSKEFLRILAKRTFAPKFFTIPGCWSKYMGENDEIILNQINWRFCGGFLLGDKESVAKFSSLCMEYFPRFIQKYRKLVWEVNLWAWLEHIMANVSQDPNSDKESWKPIWYKGDHSDIILHISADFCSLRLCSEPSVVRQVYDYPKIDGYEPTSASYLYYKSINGLPVHMLNTRYVNYIYTDPGRYLINDAQSRLFTKNVYSELDENTLLPKFFKEMQDPDDPINLPKLKNSWANGLEDIRLFLDNTSIINKCKDDELVESMHVKFIATTINYSPTQKNRIVIGKYDTENCTYTDCRLIDPPNKDSCGEKNWICVGPRLTHTSHPFTEDLHISSQPLVKGGGVRGDLGPPHIYTWSPQQIGSINPKTQQLEIHTVCEIIAPYFSKVRGSSQFVDYKDLDVLIGVVHFSEEYIPRHYFHMLVMLERDTMKLLKYSEIFYFDKIGIEFCIGFMIRDEKYHFWISKNDREPELVICSMNSLPFI